ncbi:MAG: DUF4397 domain-containing protein [Saprospiraceae bacterium]|jgi:hypothetical protein
MKNSVFTTAIVVLSIVCSFFGCSSSDDGPSGPSKLMFINGILDGKLSTVLVEDSVIVALTAGFGGITQYQEINSGNQNFKIRDNISNAFVVNANFNIGSAKNYSLMAIGTLSSPELIINEDDLSVADTTKGYIRLINLSANSNPMTMSISSGADLVSGVNYKSTSLFTSLSPAKHDLTIKSGATVVVSISNLNILPNKKYSILITGLVNQTPKASYNIIVNKL